MLHSQWLMERGAGVGGGGGHSWLLALGGHQVKEGWVPEPRVCCSPHCPVSLPGFPGWSPESILRVPGGERTQRAWQSVSGGDPTTGGACALWP